VSAFTFLLQVCGVYLVLQFAFLVVLRLLPPPKMLNQVRRTAYIGSANHVYLLAAGVLGAARDPIHAKINLDYVWWTLPAGLIVGFFYFVLVEVVVRLTLKQTREALYDLQELAVSPVLPRDIIVPGVANFMILRPFGEELFMRAFVIGVLSTQIHWAMAIVITVVFENLRYPQNSWLGKNILRTVIPGLIFVVAPSIILTLAMNIMYQTLAAMNQISKIRRVVAAGKAELLKDKPDVQADQDGKADDGKSEPPSPSVRL